MGTKRIAARRNEREQTDDQRALRLTRPPLVAKRARRRGKRQRSGKHHTGMNVRAEQRNRDRDVCDVRIALD
jgi:hypothetical protein